MDGYNESIYFFTENTIVDDDISGTTKSAGERVAEFVYDISTCIANIYFLDLCFLCAKEESID